MPDFNEQVSRFPKGHAPVVNMRGTHQRMWDISLTARPGLVVHFREALRDRSHDPFCPLGLQLLSHLVFHHLLYHTVDAVGLGIDIQADERVARQRFQRFVEHERVLGGGNHFGKHWAELRGSLGEQFQRNGLWTQEGAHPQHIGSDRVFLYFLEVERPGAGHRRRVVACPGLCFVEQRQALLRRKLAR